MTKVKVNPDEPLKPLGFYVLVEVVEVENMSSSGIYLGEQGLEQSAEEVGYLRAVGPTAYHGWEGCEAVEIVHDGPYILHPYQKWGLELGDMVEFRAFEGKTSVVPGYKRWRYIPDSHVVGVVNRIKDTVIPVVGEVLTGQPVSYEATYE
jgi:co-chaperonin GroES (HSP10)